MDKVYKVIRVITVAPVLALIMVGCVMSFAFPASDGMRVIFLEYVCGALAVLVFNKGFHIRLSGHACGALAPVALFLYFRLYGTAAAGMVLAVLVFVASIETRRHTFFQLIGGGLVPLISIFVIGLFL